MKIKEIKKNGVFSWSPPTSAPNKCLVIATTTQQFDNNYGSDSKLEIYDLQIDKSNVDTARVSTIDTRNTYNDIVWHNSRNAIIAATQSKTVEVYGITDKQLKLVYESDSQTSNITCIDANKDTEVLAVGCDGATVDIWQFTDSSAISKTLTLSCNLADSEATNVVKWNKCVNSILAAASNSNINIWDTRKSSNTGPIMRVVDSNASSLWGTGPQSLMISRSLCWCESQATTLAIANSNDANPIIHIWDLRYAMCPVKYMKGGHSRGIMSTSWNTFDEQLLISAAKDNTVCVWNPFVPMNEDSLIATLPYITNQWINNIEWCPWMPSLFAVNSFDSNITIYSITKSNYINQTNTKIMESFSLNSQFFPQELEPSIQPKSQPILIKAPKWFRIPCGASWGFGGKLITYDVLQSQVQSQQVSQHILSIKQVVNNTDLLERSEKLENALLNDNFLEYCHYKISENCGDEQILMAWKLVSNHLESDQQKQKETIFELLGFNYNSLPNDQIDNLTEMTSKLSTQNIINNDNAEVNQRNTMPYYLQSNSKTIDTETFTIDTQTNSIGSQINRAILNGNVTGVIDNCIASNHWTEAILFSCFVAPEYNCSTLKKYFDYCLNCNKECWSPLLWCIIVAQVSNDDEAITIFQQLIAKVDLKYWREIVAFIIKESENWEECATKLILIESIAERLINKYKESQEKSWLTAAMYCYIITGNCDYLSQYISFGTFMDQIELLLVLQKATDSQFVPNNLTSYYAKLLAIEGKLELALKYVCDKDVEFKERIIGNLRPQKHIYTSNTAPLIKRSSLHSLPPVNQSVLSTVAPQSYYPPVPNVDSSKFYYPPTNANISEPMTDGSQQFKYSQPSTPGWNDPPVFTPSSQTHKVEPQVAAVAPIFTPTMAANELSSNNLDTQKSIASISQPDRRSSLRTSNEVLSRENQIIYDCFDKLLSHIQRVIVSPPLNIKRKLEDSKLKLEAMRTKLASNTLSSNTLLGLNEIANAINQNDYHSALGYHTHLVSSTTFGETATFLPAIRVIIHLAQQHIQS